MEIGPAHIDEDGTLRVLISGQWLWAGEKYTQLERGWAVFGADDNLPAEWVSRYGETRPADDYKELASRPSMLATSHPVLVALSLRAWWHRNGLPIQTDPEVEIPTFDQAVEEVRNRKIHNSDALGYAGTVPGLERWKNQSK